MYSSSNILIILSILYFIGFSAIKDLKSDYSHKQPISLIQIDYSSVFKSFLKKHHLKAKSYDQLSKKHQSLYKKLSIKTFNKFEKESSNNLIHLKNKLSLNSETWSFWPENIIFSPIDLKTFFSYQFKKFPTDLKVIGYTHWINKSEKYNATGYFHKKYNHIGSYFKNHLFPIREYIPFEKQLPWLKKRFSHWKPFLHGKSYKIVSHPNPKGPIFLSFICFEPIIRSYFKKAIIKAKKDFPNRPIIIVNPVSDFLFGLSGENIQHSMLTRFQAAKYGLPIIRINSYGYSEIISPWGESLYRSKRGINQVLSGYLPVKEATNSL